MKKTIIKDWKTWALVAVVAIFTLDLTSHLLNFPLRLVLLRVGVHFADWTWMRLKV